MRRASSILLAQLRRRNKTAPILSVPAINSLSTDGFHTHFRRPSNSPANQSFHRNYSVLAADTSSINPPLSSRQRKIQEKSQLDDSFESAETTDEMLKAFEKMETSFEEAELGLACLKLGLKLDQEGKNPEKALSFATRALKVLDRDDGNPNLPLAMCLQLLGSTCFSLQRFSDSLGYLNRANRILGRFEEEGSCSVDDIRPILHAVHSELFNVKTAVGRREEAIVNLRKALEFKEMMLEEDSRELGNAYRDVADAYVGVLNFKEALPFCSKALEIHKGKLGLNSLEVAHDRRLLGVIYTGLEDHGNALDQNQMSQKVFQSWGKNAELLRAEIDAANMQIALGRYNVAIDTLKGVINQTPKDSEDRALIFVSMAKALCNQEKFAESKRCLVMATEILSKKEVTSPMVVAEAYMEVSMQYETMNEFETAISLLKKAQRMLERIAEEQHSVGSVSARIGWLLLLTGKVEQAVPYLEDAAERLKESFGAKHYAVGYVYNNLGAAYLELDRPQSAAQVFALAKDIMDVALGPQHADSIESCENLSKAYAAMGNYKMAIVFQEMALEAWNNHGPSGQDYADEAREQLQRLKRKADGDMASSMEAHIKTSLSPPPSNATSAS